MKLCYAATLRIRAGFTLRETLDYLQNSGAHLCNGTHGVSAIQQSSNHRREKRVGREDQKESGIVALKLPEAVTDKNPTGHIKFLIHCTDSER